MYKIQKKNYGYHLTFGGFMREEEMEEWYKESVKALKDSPDEFGVFVDMRTLKPLPAESQPKAEEGQKLYQDSGMVRSVVILDDTVTTIQFKRIARKSGIYKWERYIDASSVDDWETIGIKWIKDGIDPDQ